MTRKESHALLNEMRQTGIVPMFKSYFGTIVYCRLVGNVVRFSGCGGWAYRNTYADFYDAVRDYTLVEKKPSDFYCWGL